MKNVITKLYQDEAGFIVSAELILVSTIAVLAMVVGLSEVANAVNEELEDVATAFGRLNQTFTYNGTGGHQGEVPGSKFYDGGDHCDGQWDIYSTGPESEFAN